MGSSKSAGPESFESVDIFFSVTVILRYNSHTIYPFVVLSLIHIQLLQFNGFSILI